MPRIAWCRLYATMGSEFVLVHSFCRQYDICCSQYDILVSHRASKPKLKEWSADSMQHWI